MKNKKDHSKFINNIFNKDCIELMKEMIDADFRVDHIITDPPYNISRKNNFDTMNRQSIDFGKWDKNFNQIKWISYATKILKQDGSILIFNDWKNMGMIAEQLEKNNFIIKDLIRWVKTNPMPRNVNRRYVTDYEFIIWAVPKKSKWTFNNDKEKGKYLKPEIKTSVYLSKNRIHPTQKHPKLIERLIDIHTNSNEIIFDPFAGSGEISMCSLNKDRYFLASEINPIFFKKASQRLKTITRPIFNHLGNKYRLLEELLSIFPKENIDNFVDVFTGSGVVFASYKFAKKYYINDKQVELIKIFEKIKSKKEKDLINDIENILSKYNLTKNKVYSSNNKNKDITILERERERERERALII